MFLVIAYIEINQRRSKNMKLIYPKKIPKRRLNEFTYLST